MSNVAPSAGSHPESDDQPVVFTPRTRDLPEGLDPLSVLASPTGEAPSLPAHAQPLRFEPVQAATEDNWGEYAVEAPTTLDPVIPSAITSEVAPEPASAAPSVVPAAPAAIPMPVLPEALAPEHQPSAAAGLGDLFAMPAPAPAPAQEPDQPVAAPAAPVVPEAPAAPPQPAAPQMYQPASPVAAPLIPTAASAAMQAAMMSGAADRRYTEGLRLWPIVDQVLLVAGTDPIMQPKNAALEFTRDLEVDTRQRNEFFDVLKPRLASAGVRIPDTRDVPFVLQMAYDEILGISVLGDLWRDAEVTEIMVDRWDRIVVEKGGILYPTAVKFRNPDHASAVARALALRISDRALSNSIPVVTAELPQARVQFAYGPVVKGGLSITIRKFKPLIGLEALMSYGSLNEEMRAFLQDCVEARAGVLVSGGTGTGKTTIINLLSSFIPDSERVITIEDAFELQLSNTHWVPLQTKEASSLDDEVNVDLSALLRSTLRMRPDRIVVGEIREGEGASVMLAAANTGHDGTMTTIHANSANMAMNERFVDLIRQVRAASDDVSIRRTIASAFNLVVQVTRGKGGRRFISEIASVESVDPETGLIVMLPVFRAHLTPEGQVEFTRFPVDPDSSIGHMLEEKEVLHKWTDNPA